MRLCKSSEVFERPLERVAQIINPAPRSFLQKWLIYALSGSRQIVYKKQCSLRGAEGAACQWHAFSTDRSGAETARPVDVRLGPTEAERRRCVPVARVYTRRVRRHRPKRSGEEMSSGHFPGSNPAASTLHAQGLRDSETLIFSKNFAFLKLFSNFLRLFPH